MDALDPYALLVHQGMIEDIFLDDMRERGMEVRRNCPFESYSTGEGKDSQVKVRYMDMNAGNTKELRSQYLVGCDGAHSKVRKAMLKADSVGQSENSTWGVLDGKFAGISCSGTSHKLSRSD